MEAGGAFKGLMNMRGGRACEHTADTERERERARASERAREREREREEIARDPEIRRIVKFITRKFRDTESELERDTQREREMKS